MHIRDRRRWAQETGPRAGLERALCGPECGPGHDGVRSSLVSYMRVFVDFILVIRHGRFWDCHAELIYLYPPWSYFGSRCSVHLASV